MPCAFELEAVSSFRFSRDVAAGAAGEAGGAVEAAAVTAEAGVFVNLGDTAGDETASGTLGLA